MMSLANYFTFIRIFISPIFLLLYIKHDALGISSTLLPYILLFLFGVSELSDLVDGYIARRRGEVTDLGKILDPMADSIYRISVFLTFTEAPVQLPMLIVFMFLYRDSCISTLRTICALKGFTLAARPSGKLKAVIQALSAFTVLILMIPHSLGKISNETLQVTCAWVVLFAGIYTLISGLDYLIANRSYIRLVLTKRGIND